MKLRRFLIYVTLGSLSASAGARAASFQVGIGGGYGQITLPHSGVQSVYRGPSLLADLRLSYTARAQGAIGLDVFGGFGRNFGSNTSAPSEKHLQSAYWIGSDVKAGAFFLGIQYSFAKSEIDLTNGTAIGMNYDLLGLRGGLQFPLGAKVHVSVGGVYQFGTALPGGSSGITTYQEVSSLTGYMTLHFEVAP